MVDIDDTQNLSGLLLFTGIRTGIVGSKGRVDKRVDKLSVIDSLAQWQISKTEALHFHPQLD